MTTYVSSTMLSGLHRLSQLIISTILLLSSSLYRGEIAHVHTANRTGIETQADWVQNPSARLLSSTTSSHNLHSAWQCTRHIIN